VSGASRARLGLFDQQGDYDASGHHDVVARGDDGAHDRLVDDLAVTLSGACVAA
jgi:hypothetical protein